MLFATSHRRGPRGDGGVGGSYNCCTKESKEFDWPVCRHETAIHRAKVLTSARKKIAFIQEELETSQKVQESRNIFFCTLILLKGKVNMKRTVYISYWFFFSSKNHSISWC
jgi:hypothetical protein